MFSNIKSGVKEEIPWFIASPIIFPSSIFSLSFSRTECINLSSVAEKESFPESSSIFSERSKETSFSSLPCITFFSLNLFIILGKFPEFLIDVFEGRLQVFCRRNQPYPVANHRNNSILDVFEFHIFSVFQERIRLRPFIKVYRCPDTWLFFKLLVLPEHSYKVN